MMMVLVVTGERLSHCDGDFLYISGSGFLFWGVYYVSINLSSCKIIPKHKSLAKTKASCVCVGVSKISY